MPDAAVRSALIVATDEYQDPGLAKLRSPAQDAGQLADVLGDEAIGAFHVDTLLNKPQYSVLEELEAFLADRARHDLLVLYFSCHGVKDDDGRLYFATTNTKRNRLASTAIPADWVNEQIGRCRSNRVILLLDCCYSGAFARGVKGDPIVAIKERFDGKGRVVLTASNAIEYSFEGEEVSGLGRPSVFTGALVHGLRTGEADRGGDGLIDVDELYEYVYGKVREVAPNQTPSKWALGVEGELYIARSRAEVQPTPLPVELAHALESPFPSVREDAVQALSQLLAGGNRGLALSARAALHRIAEDDDSRRVSALAQQALTQQSEGRIDIRPLPKNAVTVQDKPATANTSEKLKNEQPIEAPAPWPRESQRGRADDRALSTDPDDTVGSVETRALSDAAAHDSLRSSGWIGVGGAALLLLALLGKYLAGSDLRLYDLPSEFVRVSALAVLTFVPSAALVRRRGNLRGFVCLLIGVAALLPGECVLRYSTISRGGRSPGLGLALLECGLAAVVLAAARAGWLSRSTLSTQEPKRRTAYLLSVVLAGVVAAILATTFIETSRFDVPRDAAFIFVVALIGAVAAAFLTPQMRQRRSAGLAVCLVAALAAVYVVGSSTGYAGEDSFWTVVKFGMAACAGIGSLAVATFAIQSDRRATAGVMCGLVLAAGALALPGISEESGFGLQSPMTAGLVGALALGAALAVVLGAAGRNGRRSSAPS